MDAKREAPTYYGVDLGAPDFTHIHLLSGLKGREVSRCDGEVVIQTDAGWSQSYDETALHLFWAPLNSDSQGETA